MAESLLADLLLGRRQIPTLQIQLIFETRSDPSEKGTGIRYAPTANLEIANESIISAPSTRGGVVFSTPQRNSRVSPLLASMVDQSQNSDRYLKHASLRTTGSESIEPFTKRRFTLSGLDFDYHMPAKPFVVEMFAVYVFANNSAPQWFQAALTFKTDDWYDDRQGVWKFDEHLPRCWDRPLIGHHYFATRKECGAFVASLV